MASLLSKIQTLISADLNRLVDRSLDANDPAIFQQHIRELQKMQGQLTDQMVALRAQITAMRRKSDEQQALVVQARPRSGSTAPDRAAGRTPWPHRNG